MIEQIIFRNVLLKFFMVAILAVSMAFSPLLVYAQVEGGEGVGEPTQEEEGSDEEGDGDEGEENEDGDEEEENNEDEGEEGNEDEEGDDENEGNEEGEGNDENEGEEGDEESTDETGDQEGGQEGEGEEGNEEGEEEGGDGEPLFQALFAPSSLSLISVEYPYGIITAPEEDEMVMGEIDFLAEYYDGDDENDDIVQWAVRFETCSANTNTVFGNVDGYSDSYDWDGMYFSSTLDIDTLEPGDYCFVFNPKDDGEVDVRETQWFTVKEPGDDFDPGDYTDYDELCLYTTLEGEYAAAEAVYENQGLTNDDGAVRSQRSNPEQGLEFEPAKSETNFYSLGFDGTLIVKFDTPIVNGTGDDVRIIETTWSSYPTETVDVYASKNGVDWELLGEAQSENGSGSDINFETDFDLGSLDWAQFIKIVETSDVDDFDAHKGADGFDLNAVLALNVGEFDECHPACSEVMYGVNDRSEINLVDPLTGEVTYLDDIALPSWAVAVDPDTELVYYLSTNGNTLGVYDPFNKTNDTVAITGDDVANVSRLTFHPEDGLLYAGDQDLDLFTITTAGVATNLGAISGAGAGGGDIAFGPDGTLYLVTYDGTYSNLYEVDYSGAPVATLLGDTGLSRPSGIAWYDDGLYISSMSSSDNKVQIYFVELDDVENPTAVGEVEDVRNQDLATCVPYEKPKDDIDDPLCLVEGYKYDEEGAPLSGWTIGLAGYVYDVYTLKVVDDEDDYSSYRETIATDVTDENGYYCLSYEFDEYETGSDYIVYEELQSDWFAVDVEVNGSSTVWQSDSFFDVFVDVSLFGEGPEQVDFYNEFDDGGDTPPSDDSETSGDDGGTITGGFAGFAPTSGSVLGAFSGSVLGDNTCSLYLTSYLRQGQANDAEQVMKLQQFLTEQSIPVPVTGFFGPLTDAAVREFQTRYADEVLTPWQTIGLGTGNPTGYVFKTTRWKVNDIVCPGIEAFPVLP